MFISKPQTNQLTKETRRSFCCHLAAAHVHLKDENKQKTHIAKHMRTWPVCMLPLHWRNLKTPRLVVQISLDAAEKVELCGTSWDPSGSRADHNIASSITAEQPSSETAALLASAPRVNHLGKKYTWVNGTEGGPDKEAPPHWVCPIIKTYTPLWYRSRHNNQHKMISFWITFL